jgi:hypothetical protein
VDEAARPCQTKSCPEADAHVDPDGSTVGRTKNRGPAVPEDSGTARRRLRRFTLGSGPLKRGSDRIQFGARVLLLVVVLTAVPVALAVATATATQTRSVADAEAADRHQVTATLAEDAVVSAADTGQAGPGTSVAATWTAPPGIARTGVVHVPAAAKAGATVTIWVDRKGAVTTKPLGGADVVARAISYSVPTFFGTSALAILGYVGLRGLLDRSRMRRWTADWAVVEPVWSRKVP